MEDKKYKMSKEEADLELKVNGGKLVDDSIESFVSLQNINKVYPNGVHAVYDFNLEINKHDFVALVGPSGCGKSTTLRMIAGLEEISSGSLYINKTYSNYLQSKDRNIAMVFQSYALYPHLSVFENIAFGLKIRKLPKEEIEQRVFEVADILDLGSYLDRKPKELSGGQMQRVALGRAMVRKVDLFLMDEPLSNLDAKLRVQMRSEIVRIHNEVGATTIYVTHDQTEAMTMANKLVVMNKGFIQQIGAAKEVYDHPNNLFVATFIGSPSMNIIKANYKDNKLVFDNGLIIDSLPVNFAKKYQDFHLKQINEIDEILSNIDSMTDEKIAKMKASQIFSKNENKKIEEPKKKESFFTKLKKHSKKALAEAKEREREILKNEFIGLKEKYSNTLNSGELKIGIRPEHVYLANYFRGTKASNSFKAKPTLIELLGSEYILHFNVFDIDFEVKLSESETFDKEKEFELVFDLDRMHIFDIDSGLTIK